MSYANNKGADQPAHPRSLISAFVVHCIDCKIPIVSISEISSLYLAYVAVQAGLSLPWSQTPETGFLMTRLIRSLQLLWFASTVMNSTSRMEVRVGVEMKEGLIFYIFRHRS